MPLRKEEKDKILSTVYYRVYENDHDQELPLYSKPFFRNIIHEAMDEYAKQCVASEAEKANELVEALRIIRDSFWSDGEPMHERLDDLKNIAKTAISNYKK